MFRPIKFRAWHRDLNQMDIVTRMTFGLPPTGHPAFLIHCNDGTENYITGNCEEDGDMILMQFTGLLDKNGKEIYEGDILDQCGDNFPCVVEYRLPLEVEIPGFYAIENRPKYNKTKYYPRTHSLPHLTIKPTIIGNIYENPELLE